MKFSTVGVILSGVYVVTCFFLVLTQGLFGESFIAIILGFPWTLFLSFFEFWNVSGALLYFAILAPMVLNAILLYAVGAFIQNRFRRPKAIRERRDGSGL